LALRMRNAKRWLLWRNVPGRKGGKSRKVPYYVGGTKRHGDLDMPEDAARLATFQQAVASLESGRWSGLGFALGPDGSGNHWQGIDLDHLSSNEAAAALVDQLPGYVETSPSGDGRHAIGYGREFAALGSNGSGIEAYSGARYFTVTGDAVSAGVLTDLAPFVEQTLAPKHKNKVNGAIVLTSDINNATATVSPETIAELRSALAFMRADNYDDFVANGQRLKSLGEVGRGLWIEWAQTSDKWPLLMPASGMALKVNVPDTRLCSLRLSQQAGPTPGAEALMHGRRQWRRPPGSMVSTSPHSLVKPLRLALGS